LSRLKDNRTKFAELIDEFNQDPDNEEKVLLKVLGKEDVWSEQRKGISQKEVVVL
jgi:hypothetical protein